MKTGIMSAAVCMIVSAGLFGCGGGGGSSPNMATAVDSINITNITPASAVAGASTTFTIDVAYALVSKNSGSLMVGFNTTSPNSFNMVSSQEFAVTKGSGTHTFSATVAPVNWSAAGGTFQASVNLSENPHPTPWTPLASDSKTISVN